MSKAKIIMVANQKGGSGKSTTVRELCYLYGKRGKKVLGVDLDPQKGLTLRSPVEPTKKTIKAVIEGYIDISDAIVETEFYDMVPGDERLKDANVMFQNNEDKAILKYVFEDLDYDYILMDLAPGDSVLYDMAIMAADYIVVTVDSSPEALTGVAKMKAAVDQYNNDGFSNAKFIGTLMCRTKMQFGKMTNLYQDRRTELEELIKPMIGAGPFETYIRDHDRCGQANSLQMAVNEIDENCSAAKDYEQLADEIESRIN